MPLTEGQTKTFHYRDFSKGIQQTASRPALDDKESWWLENVQPIGNGDLRILKPRADYYWTPGVGIATFWGVTLKIAGVETARFITIHTDGSANQVDPVNPAGIVNIAGAGTFTNKTRVTMWQDTPVLLGDPTKGYFSWDGTTLVKYPKATTGTIATGSPIVTAIPSTAGFAPGMHLLGVGIPAGTTILSVDSGTQITMTAAATANTAGLAITIGAGAPTSVFDLAVFESRAILITATRTRVMTAPASYTDFQTADGALTSQLTDSVFAGDIKRILSALEVLWEIGPSAVNGLSNIQLTAGVTTFSDTNIVANIGSLWPSSVTSFFRTFLFLTPYGVYAIVGATPQKLSDSLDGVFKDLTLGPDNPAAVMVLNSIFVWCVLVTYNDPISNQSRNVLLCLSRNAWFIGNQNNGNLTWISSVVNLTTGNHDLWGTDGTHLFKCFAGTVPGYYKWQTKQYDWQEFTRTKQQLRLALELQRVSQSVNMVVTVENEDSRSKVLSMRLDQANLVFTGAAGVAITFTGAAGQPITWGIGQMKAVGYSDMSGDYLGIQVEGTSLPFTISALAQEILPAGEWTT